MSNSGYDSTYRVSGDERNSLTVALLIIVAHPKQECSAEVTCGIVFGAVAGTPTPSSVHHRDFSP